MSIVYLAAPYSDPDPKVVEYRMAEFCRCDAALNKQGIFTVSPLLKHLVLQHSDLPGDWNYWKEYSIELLKRCDKMIVLTMDGWGSSTGVRAEINLCSDIGVPIEYISPDVLLAHKMRVNVEEIKALKARLNEINLIPLSDIEWFENGKKLDIAPEVLEEWKFIGLSNVEFIMTGFYGTTIVKLNK